MKPSSHYQFTEQLRSVSDRHFETLQEDFIATAQSFDSQNMGELLFIPEALTYFYGEPLYKNLSREQQIQLNRLSWCHTYMITMIGECGVNMMSTHNAYQHMKQGRPNVGFYALREVSEEAVHCESFSIIIEKVLAFYQIDFKYFVEKMAYPQERYWDAFVLGHRLIRTFLGHYDFYYLSRYPMNLVGRSHEQVVANAKGLHPVIQKIVTHHLVDETRHMTMSKKAGLLAINEKSPRWMTPMVAGVYALYALGQRNYGPPRRASITNQSPLVGMLELCGVSHSEAVKAYNDYRSRVNQPQLQPEILKMRHYLLKHNLHYIEQFHVSSTTKYWLGKLLRSKMIDE